MKPLQTLFLFAMAIVALAAEAQKMSSVVRLDPALDEIVRLGAKVEKLAGDFQHLEGPVWVRREGHLIFSDMPANVIYKWNPTDGKVSVFLENSGFTSTDASGPGMQQNKAEGVPPADSDSNGITVDRMGRIVYCARGDRQVVRLEMDGRRTVLASQFEGKPLNRPNDLVYRSDGTLYFTDPSDGSEREENIQGAVPVSHVFLLQDGKLRSLPHDLLHPNGLAFTPDEKHLYIVDSRATKTITRYDVLPDGTLASGRLFIDMKSVDAPEGPDGMKVDQKGNVYAPGPGGLWIMSPTGKHLGIILIPERASNLAFGDADGKTLYVTGRTELYRIRLQVPGKRP